MLAYLTYSVERRLISPLSLQSQLDHAYEDENTRGGEIIALGLGTLYAYCTVWAEYYLQSLPSSGRRLRSNNL
jgi:hypothetical protein